MSSRAFSDSTPADSSQLVGSQTPRIWTPRDPELETSGPLFSAIMELAGIELDPWQRLALDVALERAPRGAGSELSRWAHRTVTLLVARQNGKTIVLLSRILGGLYAIPSDRLILHTAQDRAVPRELFELLVTLIGDTRSLHRRLAPRGIREANGQERIKLKDGSTYRILAPRAPAFRTWSSDVLIFDEAREQHDETLWSAALPTQRARPDPQVWVASNAGGPDAVILNRLVARGRSAAELPGSDPAIAFLEWSAGDNPDGTPRALDDREAWREANPSLGIRLEERSIEEELLALDESGFRAEILCQTVKTTLPSAIPFEAWVDCSGEPEPIDVAELPRPLVGFDVDGDRRHAALSAVTLRNGRLVADLLEEWREPAPDAGVNLLEIAGDVLEWMRTLRAREFAYDRTRGSTVASRLEVKGITTHKIDATEYVIASGNLADAIANRYLVHSSNPSLDEQIRGAPRKNRSDGTWYISHADADGTISAVTALAFAVNLAYRPKIRAGVG